MKKIITTSLFAFTLLAFGLQASAFTYPGGAPTGGGANIAPLNVSSFAQIKQGILSAPFFGSHKVDIKPCIATSVLVGGGTSCNDIAAVSPYNLFRSGNSRRFLSVDDNGTTSAVSIMSMNLGTPTTIFRSGNFQNNNLTGISVDENGGFRVVSGAPTAGNVLTAVDSTGLVAWSPASGGVNLGIGNAGDVLTWDANTGTFVWQQPTSLPTGTFNQTLRYGVISPGVFGWMAESGLSSSGNTVKIFDAYNPANASVAAEGMGPTNPTLNLVGTFRYRSVGGTTPAAGNVLTSDAQGNATWQPLPPASSGINGSGTLNIIPKWTPDGSTLGNSQIRDDGTTVSINTTSTLGSLYTFRVFGSILGTQAAVFRDNVSMADLSSSSRVAIGQNASLLNSSYKLGVIGNSFFDGLVRISGGSPQSGYVLTASDLQGNATWQPSPSSLPSGNNNGDILVWNGTTWITQQPAAPATLPLGTINQTLWNNGSSWVPASILKTWGAGAGSRVEIAKPHGGQVGDTSDVLRVGNLNGQTVVGLMVNNLGVTTTSNRLNINSTLRIPSGAGNGKVLTSNNIGDATWQNLFPSGGANGNVLTLINGSPTWSTSSSNLPAGNLDYTMRYNGTEWDQTSALQTKNEGKVGIGFNSFLGQPWTSSSASLDVNGTVRIRGGNPGNGKVLTSDANGLADWQSITSKITKTSTAASSSCTGPCDRSVIALCPSGSIAIGGGGYCNGNANMYRSTTNNSGNVGWEVACNGVAGANIQAHAFAICMAP
jgi:hypothetical protein